jgi:hypothetical protein
MSGIEALQERATKEIYAEEDFRALNLTGSIEMRIAADCGDERLVWDRRFPDQLKEAQAKFYELKGKGYLISAVSKDGKKTERLLHRFDPYAEELICMPAVGGG